MVDKMQYIRDAIAKGYPDVPNLDSMSDIDVQLEVCRVWEWFNDDYNNKPIYDNESFREAAEPMIKWLNEHANPHSKVTIEQGLAVLYSGEMYESFTVPD